MLKSEEVRRQVAQRLRELLPRAKGWEESAGTKVGGQVADLLARFQLAGQEHTLVVEVTPLGQPRQIRASVTRLNEIRRELPGAYPVAGSVYIGPQSARILKSNNLGFVDLSGNCYLAFENALIEKEGKRNLRPSTRPLRSLFAPRAAGAEPQGPGRALLSRGRSGCGRAGPRPAARRRGGRRAPLLRAVRPRSVLRRLREGRAQGRVSAATLRRSRELRAPRTRASGAFAARGDGLLNNRGRR